MTHQLHSPSARDRFNAAREELSAAQALHLTEASRPTLVLYHERLRGALADMIRLIEECQS
jgi:hypothetical protein